MTIKSILKKHGLHKSDMDFLHRAIGISEVKEMLIEAKKEVFDDIEKLKLNYQGSHKMIDEEDFQMLKKRHLSTSKNEGTELPIKEIKSINELMKFKITKVFDELDELISFDGYYSLSQIELDKIKERHLSTSKK